MPNPYLCTDTCSKWYCCGEFSRSCFSLFFTHCFDWNATAGMLLFFHPFNFRLWIYLFHGALFEPIADCLSKLKLKRIINPRYNLFDFLKHKHWKLTTITTDVSFFRIKSVVLHHLEVYIGFLFLCLKTKAWVAAKYVFEFTRLEWDRWERADWIKAAIFDKSNEHLSHAGVFDI